IQYPTEPLRFDRHTEQTKVIREDDKWRQGMGALYITLIEFRKFFFIAPIVKVLNQGANQCQSEEQDDSDFHYSPKMKPVMLSAATPPPQLPAAPPRAAPAIPQAKIPVPNVEAPKTILQAVIANIAPPSPPKIPAAVLAAK
ncbi:hypothetical protein ACJ8PO_23630, partial [Serratia sp. CY66160]|uniref:hypothetical protein n=1 Tax=Serratia sp. CY66160 TaxID=3383658 RepID=UPI003F9F4C82